jgi:hypothetical protein
MLANIPSESAGARALVNEYSGSAALPAPSQAFVERTPVCSFSQLSHTPGGDTCNVYRKQSLRLSWVSIGLTPNTTSAYKPWAPIPKSAVNLTTPQRPSTREPVPSKSGSQDTRSRWGSNLTKALSSTPYVNTTSSSCSPSTLGPWPSTAKPSRRVMPKMILRTPHPNWNSCSSIATHYNPCTPRARRCVPWRKQSPSGRVFERRSSALVGPSSPRLEH